MKYSKEWKKQIVQTPWGDHVRIIGTYDNRSVVVCDKIESFDDAELILSAPKMREEISDLKEKLSKAIDMLLLVQKCQKDIDDGWEKRLGYECTNKLNLTIEELKVKGSSK